MIDGLPNPPTRFEQDPDSPDGTGTFHFQDGSSLYAHEPNLASAVLERAKADKGGEPDRRLAENSFDALDKTGGYGAPQTASDVPTRAALFQGASDANSHATSAGPMPGGYGNNAAGAVVPTRSGTMVNPPAPPAPAGQLDVPAARQLLKALPAGAGQPTAQREPPRPYVAGRAGGVVPQTVSSTQETQGAPYSLEDAELRERANQSVVGAQMANFDAQRADAEAQAAQAQAAIPVLRYKAAEGQAALNKLNQDYKEQRARVHAIIEEHDKQAKVDPDAVYHKAGTAGVIGMIIGQALGAFGAAIGHHENYAQKLIEDENQREMRAQEDEIKRGEVSDNNLLAKLQDQFDDLDQAKSALKLVQGELQDRQIQAYAEASKSAEAQRTAQLWLAQNQQQRLAEEQHFRDLSIGKQTTSTAAKVVTPVAGHRMTDDELIAYQTRQNKARAGLLSSENELGYQRQGGEQADKLMKRGEGKGVSPRAQGQIVAARNARDVVAELAGNLGMKRDKNGEFGDPGVLDTLWSKVPFSDVHQNVSMLRNSLAAEIGKAQTGGILSEGEAKSMHDQLDSLHTPGQIGAFVRHYDNMMKNVEQNVRGVAASSRSTGGNDEPEGGQ